jgi:hypothetical protein
MLTAHELFGFMPQALAAQILESAHSEDKEVYRLALNAVAEARRVRPIYYARRPRAERHSDMASMLARPRLDLIAANLIRSWLVKKHTPMLVAFMESLGIPHKDGTVEDLPESVDDARLNEGLDKLLSEFPSAEVAIYLNAFYSMNEVNWPNLKSKLETDPRLQFGG